MVKAATMITEAKSSVLQRWQVASRQSAGLATGTGTDQFALLAPVLDPSVSALAWQRQWAGAHAKLGELIARSVQQATDRALAQQNGFAPTHRRSVLVALERFGVTEEFLRQQAEIRLSPEQARLLSLNFLALMHDPLSAAAAFAFAHIVDVVRGDLVPIETAPAALRQQAQFLAQAVAQQEHLPPLPEIPGLSELSHVSTDARDLVEQVPSMVAIAVFHGFSHRWPNKVTAV